MGKIMIKRTFVTLSSAVLLVSSFSTPIMASDDAAIQQALEMLDAQLPGKLINNPYKIKWNGYGSDKKASIVKSEGAPGGTAYKVVVKKKKKDFWETAIRIPMTETVAKGDVILVSYWARAAKPQKGKETGDITIALQRNIEPYDSVFEKRTALDKEWKLYNVTGKAKREYAADKTNLNFNLAHSKQTLEFGQFYIMNLGPNGDASKYMK